MPALALIVAQAFLPVIAKAIQLHLEKKAKEKEEEKKEEEKKEDEVKG